jgi:hypothetical protein
VTSDSARPSSVRGRERTQVAEVRARLLAVRLLDRNALSCPLDEPGGELLRVDNLDAIEEEYGWSSKRCPE